MRQRVVDFNEAALLLAGLEAQVAGLQARLAVAERERDEANTAWAKSVADAARRAEGVLIDQQQWHEVRGQILTDLAIERARAERLAGALREIADDPHCSYDHPTISHNSYGTGVVDGHRCAGGKARAALSPEARPLEGHAAGGQGVAPSAPDAREDGCA